MSGSGEPRSWCWRLRLYGYGRWLPHGQATIFGFQLSDRMPSDIRLLPLSQHVIRFCSRPEEWIGMKITAILPDPPRSRAYQHYNLYLDGHPACRVTDTLISELGLT